MPFLICSAVESEFSILKPELKNDSLFCETGVGLIESAIKLTSFLNSNHVDQILFTGTVGSYNKAQFKINDLVQADRSSLIAPLSLMMKGYMPELMKSEVNILANVDLPLPLVNVATVLEITSDSALVDLILDSYPVDVEHMELFSLAQCASYFNIRFSAILSISNYVGPDAHNEWLKNHQNASKVSQEYILNHFNYIKK